MARVNFTAAIEEIVGKLAGSVFQDSYGGFQIRTRVSPRNPQTSFQQLRRGEFGFITQTWRVLTNTQRNTWITNKPPGMSAFNFFVMSNVNLALLDLPISPSFAASPAPGSMPIIFSSLDPSNFTIKAFGGLTTVPANTNLLIFATSGKQPTKIFTNPTEFSPIISFPASTGLSSATSILAAWQLRFGILTEGLNLCIKSALISTLNGKRTDTSPVCSQINEIDMYKRLFTNVNQVSNNTGSPTQHYLQTIPANTFKNLGDTLYVRYAGNHGASGTLYCQPRIQSVGMGSVGAANFFGAGSNAWVANLTIVWVDTNVLQFTSYLIDDDTNFLVQNLDSGGFDAALPFDIYVNLQGQSGNFVSMQFGCVDLLSV